MEAHLLGAALQADGLDLAIDELDSHLAAPVPDHDPGEQVREGLGVLEHPPLGVLDEAGAEALEASEHALAQQFDQVVQLEQRVLDRRGGQEELEAGLEGLDELVGCGLGVLEAVRLVYHQHVPLAGGDLLGVARVLGGVEGDDQALVRPPPLEGFVVVLVGDHEGLAELGLHLAAPLGRQRRRGEDQDVLDQVADQVLLEDEARLDGLAEAHLVGEDGAAVHAVDGSHDRVDLVGQDLDAARLELVEALQLVDGPPQAQEVGLDADGLPAGGVEVGAGQAIELAAGVGVDASHGDPSTRGSEAETPA
ncbi:hypothetical protein D3C86_960590 [compost metagenome]